MIIAILPAKIRARWDRLAIEQLCEATVRLNAENERYCSDIRAADAWADQHANQADHYQALYYEACEQLAARGEVPCVRPGITLGGELVVVRVPS